MFFRLGDIFEEVSMKGLFDIVGPVMIGPSSSHTAGAARLGLMALKILGEPVVKAEILLHGSFAKTYRGHGTDKALLAGILGFEPEDDRIRNAIDIAKERKLEFSFDTVDLMDAHPNTAILKLTGESGKCTTIEGSSIGGGNIVINRIDAFEVHLTGQYPALVVVQKDKPGLINKITGVLALYEINVAYMRVFRQKRGQEAMMILETDEDLTDDVLKACRVASGVITAFAIPAI